MELDDVMKVVVSCGVVVPGAKLTGKSAGLVGWADCGVRVRFDAH